MTKYYIHFFNSTVTDIIYAPNAEEAMSRAMDKYDTVSHVEEA